MRDHLCEQSCPHSQVLSRHIPTLAAAHDRLPFSVLKMRTLVKRTRAAAMQHVLNAVPEWIRFVVTKAKPSEVNETRWIGLVIWKTLNGPVQLRKGQLWCWLYEVALTFSEDWSLIFIHFCKVLIHSWATLAPRSIGFTH